MRLMIAVTVLAVGLGLAGGVPAAIPEGETAPHTVEKKAPAAHPPATLANPWIPFGLRPQHEILRSLVGKATTAVHVNEGPFPPKARDSQGTADAKLLMGGLFVQVNLTDTRMKQPFERMMIYGFDQVIGKYTADVLDTTSTAVVRFIGTYDADKKQLNMTARYSDQKSRRYVTARLVTTFVDDKTWSYEEFASEGPDQPEYAVASVTFKRG